MVQFLKSISSLLGLYLLYKIIVVVGIGFIQQSSYNVNANAFQTDYGSNKGKQRVIIAGSSNTRYNFDYSYLNHSFPDYAFRSASASAPYGLYFTLKKVQSLVEASDIIVVDVPYTLYNRDQFLPLNEYTLGLIQAKDYSDIFSFSPKILGSFIFQESVFNPVVWTYFSKVYQKYKRKNFLEGASNKSGKYWMDIVQTQDFGEEYNNCSNRYNADRHFIRDVKLEAAFLKEIKEYIDSKINAPVNFLYPEINKNNNSISVETRKIMQQDLQPVNSFETSEFSNNCMFDQNYHLNQCGAVLNTENIIKALGLKVNK